MVALTMGFVVSTSCSAADTVSVRKVDFDEVKLGADQWIQCLVELDAKMPVKKDQGDVPNFVDNVKVEVVLAYKVDSGASTATEKFRTYTSSVQLSTLEVGKQTDIYFFIPHQIRKKYNLPKRPFAHIVKVTVGGEVQESNNVSVKVPGAAKEARSLMDLAEKQKTDSEGVLLPIYDTPFYGTGGAYIKNLAPYKLKSRGSSN